MRADVQEPDSRHAALDELAKDGKVQSDLNSLPIVSITAPDTGKTPNGGALIPVGVNRVDAPIYEEYDPYRGGLGWR